MFGVSAISEIKGDGMKKCLAILVLFILVASVWGQSAGWNQSKILVFNIRTDTPPIIEVALDGYLKGGFEIISTVLYGDELYVFLQIKWR